MALGSEAVTPICQHPHPLLAQIWLLHEDESKISNV